MTVPVGPGAASDRLASRLSRSGHASEAVVDAILSVPRHAFVPRRIRVDGRWLDRADSPEAWLEAAYADEPIVTQVDDGRPGGPGVVSSSISKPSLVADMLTRLGVGRGDRVLELGTGSGWNAALLCALAGEDGVTTVEVDPRLHEQARTGLAAAGHAPTAVLGDGLDGHPPGAPYDRILSTMAVRRIPGAWVSQLAPGGRLLTPWGTPYHNGVLADLTLGADGGAHGRFSGNAAFMWARSQRTPHGAVEDRVRPEHDFTETLTGMYPDEAVGDFDGAFAVGLFLPDVKNTIVWEDDVPGADRFTVYLMDPCTGSWASWHVDAARSRYPVRQHGPRRLFDELEAAVGWWTGAGRPAHDRFGLSAHPDGHQELWLDAPDRVLPVPPSQEDIDRAWALLKEHRGPQAPMPSDEDLRRSSEFWTPERLASAEPFDRDPVGVSGEPPRLTAEQMEHHRRRQRDYDFISRTLAWVFHDKGRREPRPLGGKPPNATEPSSNGDQDPS